MAEEMLVLRGTVEAVVFSSEATGFTVLALDAGEELVTVVGEMPGIATGEELELTGRFTSHPTYGQQFKAEFYERTLPATAAAIRRYLSSGVIKGLGPKTAAALVNAFGDDTLTVLEQTPERLAEAKGVSPKKAADIAQQYRQIFGVRSVMLYLSKYQVESSVAIRVWRQWGPHALQIVEENPFKMCCEAVELPFQKADAIALQAGMAPEDPRRIAAGIAYVLSHNLNNGHTCLPVDKLLPTAAGLLEVDSTLIEDVVHERAKEGDFISDTVEGCNFLYLPALYEAETYVAGRIRMMLGNAPPLEVSYHKQISQLEQRLGITYAAMQKKAMEMALKNQVFILTGGPGTGKTTTLNALLSLLEAEGEKVVLAAPTGRAAKRMSEVTGKEAKTIHRLLEVDFKDKENRNRFKRDAKNPLRCTAVILDEASMVDTRLMHSLLQAMRMSCKLVLVGDPDQLPSVGPGNILKDLIESDVVPMVQLTEIFRQASQSHIVESAHEIVAGRMPNLSVRDRDMFFLKTPSYEATLETVVALCKKRLPAAYGLSPMWDIQVLSPSRVGALGTVELNRALQQALNPENPQLAQFKYGNAVLREGDKVMQVKNNYDIPWKKEDGEQGTGVFNGDIGVIRMIDRPSQTIIIQFDDREAVYTFDMAGELEHAYAITVHKSQGSEFEAVVMPLMNYHPRLYYRNLLYTAVTRAKKLLILLGRQETVWSMVENDRKVLRYTNLRTFVAEGDGNGVAGTV